MLEISARNIKIWSRLGPRAVYGMALTDEIMADNRIYAMSADLGQSSGLVRLMIAEPNRYINVGIAEQNLIGVAAGMAKAGLIPFASSFAPFITLRCADQVRMNLGYMGLNIKLVGLSSGCSMGYLGYSHYGMEDLAFLRAIPGMVILSPSDCGQVVSAIHTAIGHDGPVYIRLTGEPGMPVVHEKGAEMMIGGSHLVRQGQDVAFIATGSMVAIAMDVSEQLSTEGIECSVIDMYSISPIDQKMLDRIPGSTNLIVTVEEHGVIGGLGSAVSEYLSTKKSSPPILRIGMPEQYFKVGSYSFMLEKCGLTPEQIAKNVREKMRVYV